MKRSLIERVDKSMKSTYYFPEMLKYISDVLAKYDSKLQVRINYEDYEDTYPIEFNAELIPHIEPVDHHFTLKLSTVYNDSMFIHYDRYYHLVSIDSSMQIVFPDASVFHKDIKENADLVSFKDIYKLLKEKDALEFWYMLIYLIAMHPDIAYLNSTNEEW